MRVIALLALVFVLVFVGYVAAMIFRSETEDADPGPPVDEATAEANWRHLQLAIRWIERTLEFDSFTPTLTERQRQEGRRLIDAFYPEDNKEQP
jgi:hypothetical protein